jgi:hypothetical protein
VSFKYLIPYCNTIKEMISDSYTAEAALFAQVLQCMVGCNEERIRNKV